MKCILIAWCWFTLKIDAQTYFAVVRYFMVEIAKLRGLGPKSANMLAAVGIHSEADLKKVGAVQAYMKVTHQTDFKPGKNLLYAMIGALEDQDWRTIAREQRASLIFALEGYEKLEEIFKEDGYTS